MIKRSATLRLMYHPPGCLVIAKPVAAALLECPAGTVGLPVWRAAPVSQTVMKPQAAWNSKSPGAPCGCLPTACWLHRGLSHVCTILQPWRGLDTHVAGDG